MANSAHVTALAHDRDQYGNLGKLLTRRATITFGDDYDSDVLPRITAGELGLSEVIGVSPEGQCSGTKIGCAAVPAIATGGASFTLALFNGQNPIGAIDATGTSVNLLVIGH